MKTVTVTISNDTSYLGDAATSDDLDRWGANLCAAIEEKFGVSVLCVNGSSERSCDCDDPEIRDWLREISQSDAWQRYL